MWFKQAKIFELRKPILGDALMLAEQLEPLVFIPCLPSLPASYGWASPLDEEDAPLVHAINGYKVICLQLEEKILPTTVVQQELNKKVKEVEAQHDRKLSQKEKYAIKDSIIQMFLPRAFSKLSRVYAYIDTKNHWLVVDTANPTRAETLIDFFKRSIKETDIHPIKTEKLAPILTRWLLYQDYPQSFSVDKACLLKDPNKQSRTIRCQQQDLSASGIQLILKDGCEVSQLALSWQDQVNFVLSEDFSLRNIKFQNEIVMQSQEMELDKKQQFDADLFIMVETFAALLKDLLTLFTKSPVEVIQHEQSKGTVAA